MCQRAKEIYVLQVAAQKSKFKKRIMSVNNLHQQAHSVVLSHQHATRIWTSFVMKQQQIETSFDYVTLHVHSQCPYHLWRCNCFQKTTCSWQIGAESLRQKSGQHKRNVPMYTTSHRAGPVSAQFVSARCVSAQAYTAQFITRNFVPRSSIRRSSLKAAVNPHKLLWSQCRCRRRITLCTYPMFPLSCLLDTADVVSMCIFLFVLVSCGWKQ